MKTQFVGGAEKLANASRTQGLWSIGGLAIQLMVVLFGEIVDERSGLAFVLGCLFTLLLFSNVFLGLLACSVALIALWMNWGASKDAMIKRTATMGLVLGVIPIALTIGFILFGILSGM